MRKDLTSKMYYKYITIDRNGAITIWKHKPRYYKTTGIWHIGRKKYENVYNECICIGKCSKVVGSTCWKINDMDIANS